MDIGATETERVDANVAAVPRSTLRHNLRVIMKHDADADDVLRVNVRWLNTS